MRSRLECRDRKQFLTGMNGVDGKALLQEVRADLSVTRKQIDANDELESIEAFYGRQAYSYAYAA